MSNAVASNDSRAPDMVPNLLSIAKTMRALHGLKLAELGFHNGQDELLIAIDGPNVTINLIADRLSIRPSTVSKMMDRLVVKGYVERVADSRDARRTLVRITASGIQARQQLVQVWQALERDLMKSFGEDLCPSVARSLAECQAHLSFTLRRLR